MTIQGIQIDGQGTFNDVTENAGVVSTAVFSNSASNSGTISLSAEFGDATANHGTVTTAVFAGSAVNTGTVEKAEFYDGAMNAGTITLSAKFLDKASNTGTVTTAYFGGSAVNDGGTITGNAILADTASNLGTIQGDVQVAATATQAGTVGGTVSEYVPPATSNWYDDASSAAHAVTLNGTVTQSDEGSGVIAALFDGSTGYFNINSFNFDLSEDSTIEFWMKPTFNGQVTILGQYSALNLGIDNNQKTFVNNAYADVGTLFDADIDQWQHIALVTEAGTKKFYKNGILMATNNQTFNNLTALTLGYVYSNHYSGKLAGLRAVAGTAVYTSNFSVPTSLPTAVTGTELLLNFGATAAPTVTVTYDSWAGYYADCNHQYSAHNSLYTVHNTPLAIGTQMYQSQGVPWTQNNGEGALLVDGYVYHWSNGVVDSITSCSGY